VAVTFNQEDMTGVPAIIRYRYSHGVRFVSRCQLGSVVYFDRNGYVNANGIDCYLDGHCGCHNSQAAVRSLQHVYWVVTTGAESCKIQNGLLHKRNRSKPSSSKYAERRKWPRSILLWRCHVSGYCLLRHSVFFAFSVTRFSPLPAL